MKTQFIHLRDNGFEHAKHTSRGCNRAKPGTIHTIYVARMGISFRAKLASGGRTSKGAAGRGPAAANQRRRGASLLPCTAHAYVQYNNLIRGQCPVLPRGLRSGAGRGGWDGRLCRVSTRHADALDPDPPRPSRRCVKGGPAGACRSFWRIARTRRRRVARAGHPRQLLAAEKSSSNEGVQYIAGVRVRIHLRPLPCGP